MCNVKFFIIIDLFFLIEIFYDKQIFLLRKKRSRSFFILKCEKSDREASLFTLECEKSDRDHFFTLCLWIRPFFPKKKKNDFFIKLELDCRKDLDKFWRLISLFWLYDFEYGRHQILVLKFWTFKFEMFSLKLEIFSDMRISRRCIASSKLAR